MQWLTLLLLFPILLLSIVFSSCQSSGPRDVTRVTPSASKEPESKAVESRPSFTGSIENVSMYPVPNNRQDLAISLVVSISNSGESSIAKRWNLEVNAADPSVPSGLEPVHINGLVDMPGIPGRKVDLGKEDLALNSAQTPISKNSKLSGILTFVLAKTSEARLGE